MAASFFIFIAPHLSPLYRIGWPSGIPEDSKTPLYIVQITRPLALARESQ